MTRVSAGVSVNDVIGHLTLLPHKDSTARIIVWQTPLIPRDIDNH